MARVSASSRSKVKDVNLPTVQPNVVLMEHVTTPVANVHVLDCGLAQPARHANVRVIALDTEHAHHKGCVSVILSGMVKIVQSISVMESV